MFLERRRTQIAVAVTELLAKHVGGEVYFDALDQYLGSNDNFLEALFVKTYDSHSDHTFIASGGFAEKLKSYLERNPFYKVDLIKLPGGLRKDPNKLKGLIYTGKHKKAIFLDDSYYAGKTLQACTTWAESFNVKISYALVLYDGSKDTPENLLSFYRYWSYH